MMDTVVTAERLRKTYPLGAAHVEALKGVDLELKRGEFTVLLGPSGAGKTTTLNLLGCLDRPTGGSLSVAGQTVFAEDRGPGESRLDSLRRKHIGVVFTEFFLLPTLTATENVALPLLWSGKRNGGRAEELLRAVGLEHRLTHYPSELSGGEMQRVAITRALVNEPDLLLADEPTGNLDTRTRDEIFEVLQRLNRDRGLTILLATHDRELAARFPRVIHLRDGRVEGDERHD